MNDQHLFCTVILEIEEYFSCLGSCKNSPYISTTKAFQQFLKPLNIHINKFLCIYTSTVGFLATKQGANPNLARIQLMNPIHYTPLVVITEVQFLSYNMSMIRGYLQEYVKAMRSLPRLLLWPLTVVIVYYSVVAVCTGFCVVLCLCEGNKELTELGRICTVF